MSDLPPGFFLDGAAPAPSAPPAVLRGPAPTPKEPREPKTTWRTLTADEIKARGLDPNADYQVSSEGKVDVTPRQKPPAATEFQGKASAFLKRARGANDSYNGLDGDPSAPGVQQMGPRSGFGQSMSDNHPYVKATLPTWMGGDSNEMLSAKAAQDEFITTAVLRMDSGANAPPAEVEKYRSTYFPMPGDGPDQIEYKRLARQRALEGLAAEAGPYADPVAPGNGAPASGYPARSTANDTGGIPGATVASVTGDIPGGGGGGPTPNAVSTTPTAPGGRDQQFYYGVQTHAYDMWRSGASPEQINAYLDGQGLTTIDFNSPRAKRAFADAKASPGYNPFYAHPGAGKEAPAASPQAQPEQTSPLMAGVGDVIQGVGDVAGIVGNPLNAMVNAITGTNLSTDLGEVLRTDVFGIGHGDPTIEAINRGGTAALTGSLAARGAAGVMGSGVVRNAISDFAATPMRDLTAGASAGGAADTARRNGAGPGGQMLAGVAGGVLGYKGAGAFSPRGGVIAGARPSQAGKVIAAGKQVEVPVMTSDVFPPQTVVGKMARTLGENVPFAGTAGPRAAQQGSRIKAITDFANEFGLEGDDAVSAVSRDLTSTRGKRIQTLTTAKNNVIDGLQGPVETPRAVRKLAEQIVKLEGDNAEAFAPVISKMRSFGEVLSGNKTLRQIETNRKLLGEIFQDPSLASIKGEGQKALNAVYGPLREDMGAFIKANGGEGAYTRWSKANEELSHMVGELKSGSFKKLLNDADMTPENAEKLLFSQKPSEVARLVENLSDKGKVTARAAVVNRALKKATNEIGDVSPEKFLNTMRDMKTSTGALFTGQEELRMKGLLRVLESTRRASSANAEIMTGARNTGIVGAGALGALVGKYAIPIGGMAGLAARAYESSITRNMLVALARTKPGSEAEAKVGTRFLQALSKTAIPNAQRAANDTIGTVMAQSPLRAAAAPAGQDEKN